MLGVPNKRVRAIYTRHGATLWYATGHIVACRMPHSDVAPQCGAPQLLVARHNFCGMTKQITIFVVARCASLTTTNTQAYALFSCYNNLLQINGYILHLIIS
jgi:hypothetical protein